MGHSRIAIDSAPLVYFLENVPGRGPSVREVLHAASGVDVELFTSTVNEAEVLVGPLRRGDRRALSSARALFASTRTLTVVDATGEVALAAATARAELGIGLPDAFLVGTARVSRCTLLISNDNAFRRLDDIEYLHLDDHL